MLRRKVTRYAMRLRAEAPCRDYAAMMRYADTPTPPDAAGGATPPQREIRHTYFAARQASLPPYHMPPPPCLRRCRERCAPMPRADAAYACLYYAAKSADAELRRAKTEAAERQRRDAYAVMVEAMMRRATCQIRFMPS